MTFLYILCLINIHWDISFGYPILLWVHRQYHKHCTVGGHSAVCPASHKGCSEARDCLWLYKEPSWGSGLALPWLLIVPHCITRACSPRRFGSCTFSLYNSWRWQKGSVRNVNAALTFCTSARRLTCGLRRRGRQLNKRALLATGQERAWDF